MKSFRFIRAITGFCFALAAAAPAYAQPAPAPAAAIAPAAPAPVASATAGVAAAAGDTSYILGVGDVVQVSVLGRADFDVRARIGTDGAAPLPYLGAVQAIGRTPAQFGEDVRAALEKGGFYANPVVRVDLMTVASRYVTVLGYVGTPGLLPLDRDYRLSEVLARVGGRASTGADFAILTRGDGTSERFNIADLATAVREKDPPVTAGDKIYVPAAENEVFYITGQVKGPGAFPVSPGLTVRMALARGGGVTENGNEKKIKIVRKGQTIKGVKLDETVVEAGDILTVGERMF